MKVKICGITNLDDAYSAVSNGADALGFIFYPGSKRYIHPHKAKEIIDHLPFFTMKIGVFVEEVPKTVNNMARTLGLNAVQLHGGEGDDYLQKIKHPVIKAIRIGNDFDIKELSKYDGYTLLLDSYSEHAYGGTGKSFEWDKIPPEIMNRVILAGGISEDNIEAVYKKIKPQAVDISSSVEISPGIKDHAKINSFFSKLKKLRDQ